MIYDIVGDIHGHADKLEGLLNKLGYKISDGTYQQKGHQAIFVGDFIDRGTQNRRTLEIVQSMVNSGCARAVMGNHEYNAICYHTEKTETDYLRPHTASKFKQHENFLKEYPLGHTDTNDVIAWFKTLPLFIEMNDFRIIHACWDKKAIKDIAPYLNSDNTLIEEHFAESAKKGSDLFEIIERLLKGVEVDIGESFFHDKSGKKRHHIRVKWWGRKSGKCKDLAFGYDDETLDAFPDDTISILTDYNDSKPVFFGHYWQTGDPELHQEQICCVDYSAGKGGDLVCYQFDDQDNPSQLHENNFELYFE